MKNILRRIIPLSILFMIGSSANALSNHNNGFCVSEGKELKKENAILILNGTLANGKLNLAIE